MAKDLSARTLLAGFIVVLAAQPALAQAPGNEPESPVIWGIPFDGVEARWAGGVRDWTLIAEGKPSGSAAQARYEQRMILGESGWEMRARLQLPISHFEDLRGILGRFPQLDEWEGSGSIGILVTGRTGDRGSRWEGRLELADVSLVDGEGGAAVEGLAATVDWTLADGAFTTGPRQRASFQSLSWGEARTGSGELEFDMESATRWQLHRAFVNWAGGVLSSGEFALNPVDPDVTVRLRAEGIELRQLLQMAPELEAEGEGTIDGSLSLRIRRDGVRLEPGHLSLRPGTRGRLRLPARAWFTEGMSPQNPNYSNLRLVERALEDLELRQFRLDFLSEEGEAPLRLNLEGRPLAEGVPAPSVSLTLNVHGPLRELSSWMLTPGVRVGVE